MYFRHTSHRFQKEYSMDQLRKQESQNWPQITPVLSLDLLKEDLDIGPWAMAKVPLDFCKEHDMLIMGEGEDNKMVWKLKAEPAYRVFALQLGAPWRGIQALPIHIKALMVIFLARALRQRDIANRFLKQIAASAGHGKLDFTGVEEQLEEISRRQAIKMVGKPPCLCRHVYGIIIGNGANRRRIGFRGIFMVKTRGSAHVVYVQQRRPSNRGGRSGGLICPLAC